MTTSTFLFFWFLLGMTASTLLIYTSIKSDGYITVRDALIFLFYALLGPLMAILVVACFLVSKYNLHYKLKKLMEYKIGYSQETFITGVDVEDKK